MQIPKTLGEIYDLCERGEVTVLPPVVALAHLDLLASRLGEGWRERRLALEEFEVRLPERLPDADPRVATFGGQRVYSSFREAMIKLLVAAGDVSQDVWKSLKILGREAMIGRDMSDLRRPLMAAFGEAVHPADITRDMALEADAKASAPERMRLRKALGTLDALRELPSVRKAGLLREEPIGPMLHFRASGRREVSLPSSVSAFLVGCAPQVRVAVKAVYEIGVESGALDATGNVTPDMFVAPDVYPLLVEATRARHSEGTASVYLSTMVRAVLQSNPGLKHPEPWTALYAAVRAIDPRIDLNPLSHLRTRSKGLGPRDLDQTWWEDVLAAARGREAIVLRQAARRLNDLRSLDDGALLGLLPEHPLVLAPRRQDALRLPPVLQGELDRWIAETKATQAHQKVMRNALRALWTGSDRAVSVDELLEPDSINTVCDKLELAESGRDNYRKAAHRFRQWRKDSGSQPLPVSL